MTGDDDAGVSRAEIDAIVAAYMIGDMGEALRLVALRLDRDRAELKRPDLDPVRRAELSVSVRFCLIVRERLLV